MQEQKKRIKNYQGNFPIWFWANIRKDQLLSILYQQVKIDQADNTTSLLIECRIPKERVLISHYETWHHVLNDFYLPDLTLSEEKQDTAWENYEKAEETIKAKKNPELLKEFYKKTSKDKRKVMGADF